jgi:hypothetical protein
MRSFEDTNIATSSENRVGHLEGNEALEILMEASISYGVPKAGKVKNEIITPIINGLVMRCYDGRSLDSIIDSTTSILGEKIQILKAIRAFNDTRPNEENHILSRDECYSLPSYADIDIDISAECYRIYDTIFSPPHNKPPHKNPHTRDEILKFITEKDGGIYGYPYNPDAVIKYLVLMRLI